MLPYPRTWADIYLPALSHNLKLIRKVIGKDSVSIAIVVKADAYGHGLVPISRYALKSGADWCAVATVQEGIALRDAGIDARIIALSPILDIECEQAVFYDLDVLTENFESAFAMNRAAKSVGKLAKLHLKVDTGLHRFGCDPAEVVPLVKKIRTLDHVQLLGLSQHFSDSARDVAFTRKQINSWNHVLEECRQNDIHFEVLQAANSAGIAQYPEIHGTLVRAGIFAYGIDPFNLLPQPVIPVLKWTTRVTAMRNAKAGDPVGYSGTHRLSRDSRLATLGVGYGDGYPRTLSNKGVVEIHGQQAPVVGLVCMDQIIVDVTEISEAKIGDEVYLIGGSVTVPMLAVLADTNSHEIVTRIMSRVPRRYHYE